MPKSSDLSWRTAAAAIYRPPTDGRIYGTIEVDATAAQTYIREQRRVGRKLTITHLVTTALARAMAFDIPEMNAYVQRGKVIPRTSVEVMLAVLAPHGMTGVIIEAAHTKTAVAIAQEVREKALAHRKGEESKTMQNKQVLERIPWPFRAWTFRFLRWLTQEIGLPLPSLGLGVNSFGSVLVTEIGSHGLDTGMAALLPAAKLPAVIAIGKIRKKPVVVDDEIVIRDIMPVTATLDHRIVDGVQAGTLARSVRRRMQKPAQLDQIPEAELTTHGFNLESSPSSAKLERG